MDMANLSEKIKQSGKMNFSLCLYGFPGTGKSAFCKHLCEVLGIEVLLKRASDLISPYIGETEKNIANAFAEAKSKKAMLIFDEADTFLQDRTTAVRGWEISQVNEMLTQMESAEYPFACTTTEVTPANVLDYKSLDAVIVGDEKELYADRGYAPSRKMIEEKYPQIVDKIMYKRQRGKKGSRYLDLDVFREYKNRIIAKERARVEHIFAALKRIFKFTRLRYRGLERVTTKFESLIIAYNFYRLGFLMQNQRITA